MIVRQVTRAGWSLEVPGVVPKLSATPGTLRSPAPRIGEDSDAVLRELGLGDEAIAALRTKGSSADPGGGRRRQAPAPQATTSLRAAR